mmetsp:Transcript_13862/g.47929  ORF Transcript_13862/g.47929 Transcript_13862/m.47929 type:complete len:330 (+) Transcript_13862:754-1743(+)
MPPLPCAPIDDEVRLVAHHVAHLVHLLLLHPPVVARRSVKDAILRPARREGPHAASHARDVNAAVNKVLDDVSDGDRVSRDLNLRGVVAPLDFSDGGPGAAALEGRNDEQVLGLQPRPLVDLPDVRSDVIGRDHIDVGVEDEVGLGDGAGDLAQHVDGEHEDLERILPVGAHGEHDSLERLVAGGEPGTQRVCDVPPQVSLVLRAPRVEGDRHVLLPVGSSVHQHRRSIHCGDGGHGDSQRMRRRGVSAHGASEGRVRVGDAALEQLATRRGPEVGNLTGSDGCDHLSCHGHNRLIRFLPRKIVKESRADEKVAGVEGSDVVLQWLLVP